MPDSPSPRQARILVGGMAVVDFVFQLNAMPERAEKYRAEAAWVTGGGTAANAAVAIARLGGAAVLAARLGADPVGQMIAADLAAEGVDVSAIATADAGRSSFSSVLIDAAGERQIVNFRGSGLTEDPAWLDRVPGPIDAVLTDTRWPLGAARLLARARRAGVPGIVDGEAPIPVEALQVATHIAFSRQGLLSLAGDAPSLEAALHHAATRFDAWLAVTDGAAGTLVLADGQLSHVPAPVVDAVDTLGAGDVWHGAFALSIARGRPALEAVGFANAAASLKCTRPGGRAGVPTAEALTAFLEETA